MEGVAEVLEDLDTNLKSSDTNLKSSDGLWRREWRGWREAWGARKASRGEGRLEEGCAAEGGLKRGSRLRLKGRADAKAKEKDLGRGQ